MSLGVLNNIAAIYAQNNLNQSSNSLQNTLQQLSSGSKINSGADDASGLAVANDLGANISALTQSSSNATNGISLLQTADGALSQVTTLLNRAVTLSTEAANSTLNANQVSSANQEYQNILSEIGNIGSTTNFNSNKVFSASATTVFVSDGTSSGANSFKDTVGILTTASVGQSGPVAAGTASASFTQPTVPTSTTLTGQATLATGAAPTDGNTPVSFTDTPDVSTTSGDIKTATFAAGATFNAGTFTLNPNGAGPVTVTVAQGDNLAALKTDISTALTGGGYNSGANAVTVGGSATTLTLTTVAAAGNAVVVGGLTGSFGINTPSAGTAQSDSLTFTGASDLVSGNLSVTYGGNTSSIALGSNVTLATAAAAIHSANSSLTATVGTGANANKITITGANGAANTLSLDPTNVSDASPTTAASSSVSVATATDTLSGTVTLSYAGTSHTLDLSNGGAGTTLAALSTRLNAISGLSTAVTTAATGVQTLTLTGATGAANTLSFTTGGTSSAGVVNASALTDTTAASAGGSGVDFTQATVSQLTASTAQAVLTTVTTAIADVAYQRGNLGANINELTAASNVATTESTNLTSAQNNVLATNYGQAASDLAKYQVLSQTGISALAQANSVQQEVLKLLQ